MADIESPSASVLCLSPSSSYFYYIAILYPSIPLPSPYVSFFFCFSPSFCSHLITHCVFSSTFSSISVSFPPLSISILLLSAAEADAQFRSWDEAPRAVSPQHHQPPSIATEGTPTSIPAIISFTVLSRLRARRGGLRGDRGGCWPNVDVAVKRLQAEGDSSNDGRWRLRSATQVKRHRWTNIWRRKC